MIKIYGMSSCSDCSFVKQQVLGDEKYQLIDIGENVRNLKEFLKLRDNNPIFDEAKRSGSVGIPCFVLEDGTVTLTPEHAGIESKPVSEGISCSIDGKGC